MLIIQNNSRRKQNFLSINMIGIIVVVVIILLSLLAYIFFQKKSETSASSHSTSIVSQQTIRQGPAESYPNPALTPGAILPEVTESQICVAGYSATVRNVSTATKRQVFANYSIAYPPPSGEYEVDHFIPLEIGGSNDITNLWPEPADPKPGFHQKDVVENYLKRQVCNNTITLQQAQNMILTDWFVVYQSIQK